MLGLRWPTKQPPQVIDDAAAALAAFIREYLFVLLFRACAESLASENAMPDTAAHPLRNVLSKFSAPVPWMLEATIILELLLGKYVEAAIIAALLVFNAALGYFQQSRAQATTYNNRARARLWASHPSVWLVVSSLADILIASTVAIGGIAMLPLPAWVVLGTLAGAASFAVLWDFLKVPVFRRLNIT